MTAIQSQMDSMRVDVPVLSNAIPRFALHADMGRTNVAAQYLASSGIDIGQLSASVSNDSLLRFNALLNTLSIDKTRLDTIRVNAVQHGEYLVYNDRKICPPLSDHRL